MITTLWILLAIVALLLYFRKVYSKLSSEGVNHLPVVPPLGNLVWALFGFENITDFMTKLSTTFPDDKVVGMYEMLNPVYVIKDMETLKKITIKDFEHFVDRRSFTSQSDPTFGRSLLNLKGDEWKEMRSTLSPAFTSSKIRNMVPLMVDVGDEMVKVLSKRIQASEGKYIDTSAKELATRYANDVIASCAFGLKVDSQSVDSHFYLKAKEIVSFGFKQLFKVFFSRCLPSVADKVNMPLAATEASGFFTHVVLATMEERDKKKIVRHDMINILNEIKKGQLRHDKDTDVDAGAGFATVEESSIGKKTHSKEWTDIDLVAQAFVFLLAGFDTTSTAMACIIHELAINPDIQERLVQEIQEYDQKNGGNLDFNSIQSMKYMDMVVSESLRLHPPIPFLDRKCVKDYNIGRVNKTSTKDLISYLLLAVRECESPMGSDTSIAQYWYNVGRYNIPPSNLFVRIREGAAIGFPIYTFHHDSQLFPDPSKFNPERFSDENKHNIQPLSYMPFGLGPRNCIGSRFALCEVKVMIYKLLRAIKVSPCEKTEIPLTIMKGFLMNIPGGAYIRFQLR